MPEVNTSVLAQLRRSLSRLRSQDRKRNRGRLSPEDIEKLDRLSEKVLGAIGFGDEQPTGRKVLRVPLQADIKYKVGSNVYTTKTANVSVTGVAVAFNEAIANYGRLKLAIRFYDCTLFGKPKLKVVSLDGVVRWRDAELNRMGIEFLELGAKDREIIERAIHAEIARQYEVRVQSK